MVTLPILQLYRISQFYMNKFVPFLIQNQTVKINNLPVIDEDSCSRNKNLNLNHMHVC